MLHPGVHLLSLQRRVAWHCMQESSKTNSSPILKKKGAGGYSSHPSRQFSTDKDDPPRSLSPPIFSTSNKSIVGDTHPDEFEELSYRIHYIRIDNPSHQLKLASLYMQATKGPNTRPEPAKSKQDEHGHWTAWKQLGNMTKMEARKEYIQLVKSHLQSSGVLPKR